MNATILLETTEAVEINNPAGYILGFIIALFILVYLLYSLINPEKF
jgi:K+-transporting ATPase KdpF subunit